MLYNSRTLFFSKVKKKNLMNEALIAFTARQLNLSPQKKRQALKKSSFFLLNSSIKYNKSKSLSYSNSNKGHLVSCTEHLLIFF